MPRYYMEIKHKRNENIITKVIEHCRIGHFLAALDKRGWETTCCTLLNKVVEVESAGSALEAIEAGQSIH